MPPCLAFTHEAGRILILECDYTRMFLLHCCIRTLNCPVVLCTMQVASEAKVIAQQTRSNLQMRFEMLEMGVPPLPPPIPQYTMTYCDGQTDIHAQRHQLALCAC